MFSYVLLVQL